MTWLSPPSRVARPRDRRKSVIPSAIDLVNIDPAPGEVMRGRKEKPPLPTIKKQVNRLARRIGIISRELDFLFSILGGKQQDSVIDAELREPRHMHHRWHVLLHGPEQLFRHLALMMAGQRKNHSPIAALKIALPGP